MRIGYLLDTNKGGYGQPLPGREDAAATLDAMIDFDENAAPIPNLVREGGLEIGNGKFVIAAIPKKNISIDSVVIFLFIMLLFK